MGSLVVDLLLGLKIELVVASACQRLVSWPHMVTRVLSRVTAGAFLTLTKRCIFASLCGSIHLHDIILQMELLWVTKGLDTHWNLLLLLPINGSITRLPIVCLCDHDVWILDNEIVAAAHVKFQSGWSSARSLATGHLLGVELASKVARGSGLVLGLTSSAILVIPAWTKNSSIRTHSSKKHHSLKCKLS